MGSELEEQEDWMDNGMSECDGKEGTAHMGKCGGLGMLNPRM